MVKEGKESVIDELPYFPVKSEKSNEIIWMLFARYES